MIAILQIKRNRQVVDSKRSRVADSKRFYVWRSNETAKWLILHDRRVADSSRSLPIEPLIAVGFRGNLAKLGVTTLEAYQAADKLPGVIFPNLSHNMTYEYSSPVYSVEARSEELTAKIAQLYMDLISDESLIPTPFGECFKIVPVSSESRDGLIKYIVSIGRKTFRTPANATDAVHILRGKNNQNETIFKQVGIIRGGEPGKGHGATVGGFNNLDISEDGVERLDSPMSTVLTESEEEIEAKISMTPQEKIKLRTDYNCEQIKTTIMLGGSHYPVVVIKAGDFKTSDELMINGGERIDARSTAKRVHIASSVLVYVDCGNLNIEDDKKVAAFYKPGSDAAKLCINDVTEQVNLSCTLEEGIQRGNAFREENNWGIIHHGSILGAAWYKLHEHLENERGVVEKISSFCTKFFRKINIFKTGSAS